MLGGVDNGPSHPDPEVMQGCLLGGGAGAARFADRRGMAFFQPFAIEAAPFRGRPPGSHRRMLDAILRAARAGIAWPDPPPEPGNWNSGLRPHWRWTTSGLRDALPQALADGGGDADTSQMINSTIVQAHHCTAGAKVARRLRHLTIARVLGARAVASGPRGT